MMKRIGFLILAITTLAACKQKNNNIVDPAQVSIDITSPAPGQIFSKGDTVSINATITYPTELHGYEVKVIDTTTGFIVYDDAQHLHDNHFTIADKWANDGTDTAGLKLQIIAEIDHNGNTAQKEVNFEYVPD